MFPISDSAKTGKFPLFNILIIAINIYIFFRMFFLQDPESYITQYALIPSAIHVTDLATLIPFVTAMFLHGGVMHIISNMWFLWVFGDNIEGHYGKVIYLLIYFGSGVAGNIVQYSLDPSSTIPILGASGAISGILGAYFISQRHSKVKSLVPIFLIFTIIDVPAAVYIVYWFVIQLFSGVSQIGATQVGGVAFWAHIGGFVAGLLLAKLFHLPKKEQNIIEGEIVD